MSHLFHLRPGVHSDRRYLVWSVYLPSASWCLSSLPCPVPGKTQPCISWWRPHMLWVCSGWMCEKKCDLGRFGGAWSPAPSLGEGSFRGGPPSRSIPPGSTLTTLSHAHLLGSVLVHGVVLFSLQLKVTSVVIFIIVKQHMLMIKTSEMLTNKRRQNQPPILPQRQPLRFC